MSDGKGKIVDGMSYQSTLPEAYAKVKHERDNVVEAFFKLRELNRQTTEDLLELRTAARMVSSTYFCDNSTRKLVEVLNRMDDLL